MENGKSKGEEKMEEKLNEQRLQFKTFVKDHPELITDMKKHGHNWKDLYDAYQLFGNEAEIWSLYRTSEKKKGSDIKGTLKKVTEYIQELDGESVKQHLTLVDGLLTELQGYLKPKKDKEIEKVKTEQPLPRMQGFMQPQPYQNQQNYYPNWYGQQQQPPRRR